MTMQSVTLDATLESLPKLMGWVEGLIAHLPLPVHQIQLAIEEAFVNVIHYAYSGKGGKVTISFTRHGDEQVEWEMRDWGAAFDPTTMGAVSDHAINLEARRKGGLGILLMKKFMSEIHYRREGKENVLILIRKLL